MVPFSSLTSGLPRDCRSRSPNDSQLQFSAGPCAFKINLNRSRMDFLKDADVIVYGTGLPETALAASLAKAGKRVLHLDCHDRYGSLWVSPTVDELESLFESATAPSTSGVFNETSIIQGCIRNASTRRVDRGRLGSDRKTSIDLNPRLVLAGGDLVDFLVRSGIGLHLEFKLLDGTFAFQDGALKRVPLTKSDIFQDRSLAPLEKRSLMRFLTTAAQHVQSLRADQTRADLIPSFPALTASGVDVTAPFAHYLRSQGLSSSLADMIEFAIALSQAAPGRLPTLEGLERLAAYVDSIGRFGPNSSPFLVPLFGIAEFPQVLVRQAAVQGATYVLNHAPRAEASASGRVDQVHVTLDGTDHAVTCQRVLSASSGLSTSRPDGVWVHRAAVLVDKPLAPDAPLAVIAFPPGQVARLRGTAEADETPVFCLQLSSSVNVCTEGLFLLHFLKVAREGATERPEDVLRPVIDAVAVEEDGASSSSPKPSIVFSAFFDTLNTASGQPIRTAAEGLANVSVAPPPPLGLLVEPVLEQIDALAAEFGLPPRAEAYGLRSKEPEVDSDAEDVGELEGALQRIAIGVQDRGESEAESDPEKVQGEAQDVEAQETPQGGQGAVSVAVDVRREGPSEM